MRLTEISYGEAQPVESYGPGFFRIGGRVLHGQTIITPWDAGPWGGLEDAAALEGLADKVDVIFLGMGRDIAPAPPTTRVLDPGRTMSRRDQAALSSQMVIGPSLTSSTSM